MVDLLLVSDVAFLIAVAVSSFALALSIAALIVALLAITQRKYTHQEVAAMIHRSLESGIPIIPTPDKQTAQIGAIEDNGGDEILTEQELNSIVSETLEEMHTEMDELADAMARRRPDQAEMIGVKPRGGK